MISEVYNMDCMEYMRSMPDKFFDLAVVDPPYGINAPNMTMGTNMNRKDGTSRESELNHLIARQVGQTSQLNLPKWRAESIKALGNAMCPQVVYEIFRAIQHEEEESEKL